MTYNLLRYNAPGVSCTPLIYTSKNPHIITIVGYTKPDIMAINELGDNANSHTFLLTGAFNVNGVTKYKTASYVDDIGNDVTSNIVYNSEKLKLLSESTIASITRNIRLYRFQYIYPDITRDTVAINVIVAHLKAGDASGEVTIRGQEASTIMNYIQNQATGRYLIMGDFNIYRNTEAAYQSFTNFTNTGLSFIDPISAPGVWTGNASFASVHTQSPRATQFECGSSGGLDDRFDFILANNYFFQDTSTVKYIPNSYETIGNDGNHFNIALNNGQNTKYPLYIANAAYNASDHLPVKLKLKLTLNPPTGFSHIIDNCTFAGKMNPCVTTVGVLTPCVTVNGIAKCLTTTSINCNYYSVSGICTTSITSKGCTISGTTMSCKTVLGVNYIIDNCTFTGSSQPCVTTTAAILPCTIINGKLQCLTTTSVNCGYNSILNQCTTTLTSANCTVSGLTMRCATTVGYNTTGISDLFNDVWINNPANEQLTIHSSILPVVSATLYTTMGHWMATFKGNEPMQLVGMADGLYILEINLGTGYLIRKKIVIKH
ncbi:MAG: T9SS type A sorting domain-containing protein [Cytophagales bacterium]|nr:T9SS type A sorting domain-containing protein [Cytophagales bacterium]